MTLRNNLNVNGIALSLMAGLLCFIAPPSHAKSGDRLQPIEVAAESSVFDQKRNIQILKGNVVITQGSLKIEADEITVSLKNNALDTIIAKGSPTRFSQLNDEGEKSVGTCTRLEYHARKDLLQLEGDAKLAQPGSSLTGQNIEFDTAASVVRAKGNKNERVRIIIKSPSSKQ